MKRIEIWKGVSYMSHKYVYLFTEGNGKIVCGENTFDVHKGDYFFAPYSIKDKFSVTTDGNMEIVECLPALEA